MKFQYKLHIFGNMLGVSFICAVLLYAFKEQFFDHFQPCPLCLLQRVGYISAALALSLNLTRGPSPIHYGLFTLSCIFGLFVSLRQVLLHIKPEDHSYGSNILNLSLYTWNAIIFLILLTVSSIALLFSKAFKETVHEYCKFSKILVTILVIIIFVNLLTSYRLCGLGMCSEDPNKPLPVTVDNLKPIKR